MPEQKNNNNADESPKADSVRLSALLGRKAELDKQIGELGDERMKIVEQVRGLQCKYKIGDIITWSNGQYRGMVTRIGREWGDAEYVLEVDNIKKDGSVGAKRSVYPFHRPALSA